jgi:putative nucleotidyltransferase with HDIG domain
MNEFRGDGVLKKIDKSQLRLGMYIQSLDCPWMSHSFIRSHFMLRKDADLQQIQASDITAVHIDTLKGLDIPADAPLPHAPPRTGHLEELPAARQIKQEASAVIHTLLMDARMGRQVRVEHLQPVVTRITDSILRNPWTLVSLLRIREADAATFTHSVSACALLIMFGHHLGLDRTTLQEAGIGGMLHDIGKMRVPDHILNKPGELTGAEAAIMRDHVRLGVETLSQTPGVPDLAMRVAAEHHERCDGSGYPAGLHGEQISLWGRMATIVDVYDAMTSNRIYSPGLEPSVALQTLYRQCPASFDEELMEHFIAALGIYPVGSLVRLESDRLAVVLEQNQGGLLHPKVRVVYDIGRGRKLAPVDLDLSEGGDGVRCHEEPGTWNLDPGAFLAMDLQP